MKEGDKEGDEREEQKEKSEKIITYVIRQEGI